jgi:hypothetical protein
MTDRFSNSTAAAQAARNAHNAAINNSKPPVQNRSNIPSPAHQPMVLPTMVTLHKSPDPHTYHRPGSAPMLPANKGPAVRPPQVR